MDLVEFWKKHKWSVYILAAGAITFAAIIALEKFQFLERTFAGIGLGALLTALLTGFMITFTEKIGWLSNYRSEMRVLEEKIDDLPVSLQARLIYGMRSLEMKFDETEFITSHDAAEVCWLNTFFRDTDGKVDVIKHLIKEKTKVKLLFLSPKAETASEKAYYAASSTDKVAIEKNKIYYISRLQANLEWCRNLRHEISQEFGEEVSDIYLNIKFYEDSPNLPILVISERNNHGDSEIIRPTIGASGFYLDNYSSQLPYITWHTREGGGEAQLVNNLKNYFDRKWERDGTRWLDEMANDKAPPLPTQSG